MPPLFTDYNFHLRIPPHPKQIHPNETQCLIKIFQGSQEAMLLLTRCIILALQAWAWTNFTRQMTNREVKKFGASGRYTPWTAEPTIVFLAGCFGAIGLEKWLGLLLIPEPMTRAATNTRGDSFLNMFVNDSRKILFFRHHAFSLT